MKKIEYQVVYSTTRNQWEVIRCVYGPGGLDRIDTRGFFATEAEANTKAERLAKRNCK